jgi:beta-1,4-mannosyltransferase
MHKLRSKVLMMPDYRQDNPYQLLLAEKLRSRSGGFASSPKAWLCQSQTLPTLDVIFTADYRRIFPLFRAVKDNSATILHLHWLTPYLKGENWLTRLIYSLKLLTDLWLIRRSGVKIIWTVHNHLAHNTQFPRLELWLRKRISQVVHQLIVHHQYSGEYLSQSWKSKQPFTVIPHGHYRTIYPTAIAQQTARQQLNLPLDGLLYLNLGMIRPYKGIESLILAWQEWQATQELSPPNNCTLLIAGQPINETYRHHMECLLDNTPGVIFHPNFIPAAKMHLYFSAADIVVLPFTHILTSGSLILAMSYDMPIIAPRQGGIVETLGSAASLLYDTQDPQGLLKALRASTKEDLETLSQQVATACDRLSWDKIAQQTTAVYHRQVN